MSKEKKIHIVKSVIKHGLLLCVGFFWIYPFLWMISASFKGQNEKIRHLRITRLHKTKRISNAS